MSKPPANAENSADLAVETTATTTADLAAALPQSPETLLALQTLLDRTLIHDLFTRYYTSLDGGDPEGFGKYFVAGAELDVNGIVVHGQKEIADLYRRVAADKPPRTGTFRMILSNPLIEVTGTTATAQFLWTQLLNDSIKGPPQLIEQGREFDRLIKRDGQWRITQRVVIADSGLPNLFDQTYTPRKDYQLPAQ